MIIQEEEEEPGDAVGKRGNKRGSASLGVDEGEGCKKNPFSLIALSSASASKELAVPLEIPLERDRSKGSGMRGVTGLRTSAGKSRMLGERTSCLRGEKPLLLKTGKRGLMLRFLSEFLRS